MPQRQTVLVAKQAAELDIVSNGRLRLGIGIGWNQVEYEALAEDFHNRGRRSKEQVALLRAPWTQETVTFNKKWHSVTDAGIKPLPVQRPIPIWFGGRDDRVLKRIATMGDGWFPLHRPDEDARSTIHQLHEYMREAGREPSTLGMESWVSKGNRPINEWAKDIAAWNSLGASHISINTMRANLSFPNGHIDMIKRFKEIVQELPS